MNLLHKLDKSNSRPHKLALLILILFSITITLYNLNNPQVTFTDELLFEEAAFRMATTGNYLIPQLDDFVWLEKPPLYFWLTAPIFHLANFFTTSNIFDLSQSLNQDNIFLYPWIRRFWTFIAAQITLYFTYKIAKHLFSPLTGLIAYILLLTTPLFLFTTTAASLDLTATAFITISLYLYLQILTKPKNKKILATSYLLLATCISAAFLTRSFLALTPIAVIIIHQMITRQKLLTVANCLLIIVFCLLTIPWHLTAYFQHPETFTSVYLGFNLIEHGLKLTPGYEATTPFYYLRLLLTQNPWFYFILIPLLINFYNWIKENPFKSPVFSFSIFHSPFSIITLWFLIPFLALSLSSTRHAWYFIQVLPAIAILAAPKVHQVIIKLYTNTSQYLRTLFEISTLSFILAVILAITVYGNHSASSIKALQYLTQVTPPTQTIYTLTHGYLPETLLYHPRPIRVIQVKDLNQLHIGAYVYISSHDLDTTTKHLPSLTHIKTFKPNHVYINTHPAPTQ